MARGRQITRLKPPSLDPLAAKRYLLDWDGKELRRAPEGFSPLTSAALFANELPLEVEIGTGSGEYLCYLAEQNPHSNFLGIEVSRRAAHLAVALAAERQLVNLRILRADFKLLLPLMMAESWSRVYLHFPDPVHRPKDEKRRIFDQSFLDHMARVLVSAGEISVVSDKVEFFLDMLELAEGDARFQKAHIYRYLEGFEPEAKSRFQRFWERKGVFPRRFVLRKIG